mmetsp:Transcript_18298/g.8516  ORF Transcript_18298/g.8516 Transcript_18298/m.8516 type:complete len:436 (-) Transcript_18298:2501-3808(-)
MNPLAKELNTIIEKSSPNIFEMLSSIGKNLFFPKGILTQSAEAKQKAYKFNATLGIATEKGKSMCLSSTVNSIKGIVSEEFLTYAPSYGLLELRKKWQRLLFLKNRSLTGKKISLPIVTCGISHAISTVSELLVDPNDVVILPSMMWGNYNMIFAVRKEAKLSQYSLFSEKGGFNLKGFEAQVKKEALKHNKIIILLNFPHNPTGYTVTEDEADAITDILYKVADEGTKIIALADDSYFGLIYEDGIITESIFARLCSLHENILAVKMDGVTKEEFAWGLRVGFITYGIKAKNNKEELYEAIEKKTAGCVRGNISNASHLSQLIALRTMESETYFDEKKKNFNILKKRALKIKEVLSNPKYRDAWEPYNFNSGYFMCIKLKSNFDAETLRVHLLDKYGVGLIASGNKDLRVAYSCIEEKDIPELFDIVLQGINEC